MKVGLNLFGDFSDEYSPQENFESLLRQTTAARDAGFDLISAGHHYAVEAYQRFQIVPTAGRLAAETGDMHLCLWTLLPLHNPVEIAEQFATLDVITNGRIVLGPVAGYRDIEFHAFDVEKSERMARLYEKVEIIKRLWTEDDVTYRGTFHELEGVTINPKPIQDPHPPIWVGANTDRAVRNAARYGDAWAINPHEDVDTIVRQLELIDPPDGDEIRGVQPAIREVFIAESDEAAFQACKRPWGEYYDWYDQEGQSDATENPEAFRQQFEQLQEDRFVIGSPETVTEELSAFAERTGVSCLILVMRKPTLPEADALRAIELAGEHVIPELKARF